MKYTVKLLLSMKKLLIITALGSISIFFTNAQTDDIYMRPQKNIADIITAEPLPAYQITSSLDKTIVFNWKSLKSIDEISVPKIKSAGLRINPENFGTVRSPLSYKITIINNQTGRTDSIINMPEITKIRTYMLSSDESKLFFNNITDNGIELWQADLLSLTAKLLMKNVNDVFAVVPFDADSDGKYIYALNAVNINKMPPHGYQISQGPVFQTGDGKTNPSATFQDLLKNSVDEKLFDFYATSVLTKINLKTGETITIGDTAVISDFSISPDGKYILLSKIIRPYSYRVPYSQFTTSYEVISTDKPDYQTKIISEREVSERKYSNVDRGIRLPGWESDAPHTLYYIKALDNGDNKSKADFRDKLVFYNIETDKISSINLKNRFDKVFWHSKNFAIVTELNQDTKMMSAIAINPSDPEQIPDTLFVCNKENKYDYPGEFMRTVNSKGKKILLTDNNLSHVFLTWSGPSPEGEIPFMASLDLKTHVQKKIFSSKAPFYETVEAFDPKSSSAIIKRESQTEYPNLYSVNLSDINNSLKQITNFKNPYKELDKIKREVINYTREDGVSLSGNLYLPSEYVPGQKLPCLIWAYPVNYLNNESAGQTSGSNYKFTNIPNGSPAVYAFAGYAVLDKASFPIVAGDQDDDTYLNQLEMNARAAVNALIEKGIGEKGKFAAGGKSYGAFMAVNLAAHTDLFATVIAQSGAYNRTLTPFGFQNETRTLWEKPQMYLKVSPFMYADKIKIPVLLIHGQEDNNAGTYTMQSERMFSAIKGNGGIARLVLLPYESHTYQSEESNLHCAWEIITWLDKYLK